MRYFITFACYAADLHGDETGSVDQHPNLFGSRLAEANPQRVTVKRQQIDQAPHWLDREIGGRLCSASRLAVAYRSFTYSRGSVSSRTQENF